MCEKSRSALRINSSRHYLDAFAANAAASVPDGSVVLDAGAGACPYRKHFPHCQYETADFCQSNRGYAPIDHVCDLRNIPVENNRYDLVLMTQVLEHLPEPLMVLKEMCRILKPGGALWCSAPLFFEEHEAPYDFFRYTRFGMRHLLESAAFKVHSIEPLEGYFGALSYQLEAATRFLPIHPRHYGGGLRGLAAAPLAASLKGAFFVLSLAFARLDLRHAMQELHGGRDERAGMMLLADNPTLSIGVLDTSIASENAGDFIIMDAALRQLGACLPLAQRIHFPTHEKLARTSLRLQRKVAFNIACGTNLLHSHMEIVKQWRVGFLASRAMKPVILLGVGWRAKADRKTTLYTRWLLKSLLSREGIHSVRDSYTQRRLEEVGIRNVVNTACPSMWSLTPAFCSQVPAEKGEDVVMTLTDYSPDPERDRQLISLLLRAYRRVYFWCQGSGDHAYLSSLGNPNGVEIIGANLAAYDAHVCMAAFARCNIVAAR